MSNLRNKVIRLAHSNPELRSHLLPLLKEANEKRISDALDKVDWSEIKEDIVNGSMSKKDISQWVATQKGIDPLFIQMDKEHVTKLVKTLEDALKGDKIDVWKKHFPKSKMFDSGSLKDNPKAQEIMDALKKVQKDNTSANIISLPIKDLHKAPKGLLLDLSALDYGKTWEKELGKAITKKVKQLKKS